MSLNDLRNKTEWYGGALPPQTDQLSCIRISSGNWFTGLYQNKYWFQAKIYRENSEYGINNGRVSKLCVCNSRVFDSNKEIYNYDRGIDMDHPIGEEIAALFDQTHPNQ